MCLNRPLRRVPLEPFWMEFIRGLEDELAISGTTLLLQVVVDVAEEIAVYRRWSESGRVDGVVVPDIVVGDPRPAVLRAIALPAILVAQAGVADDFSTLSTDDGGAMEQVVASLAKSGHTRIGRVAGPSRFVHTVVRDQAYRAEADRRGIEATSVEADYTAESGARATLDLLDRAGGPPTAIVYDNDLMALAGLEAVQRRGLDVPGDVALLAWDDSVQCQLSSPPLTAVVHDITAYGADAGRLVLDVLAGGPVVHRRAETPVLVDRGSTDSVQRRRA